jgi:hypothetical protein
MPRRFATALPSWVIALGGSVWAVVAGGAQWAGAISLTVGASIVVSFVVQLSLQRKEGLVNRLAFTTSGSLLIAAAGVVGAWLAHGIG